MEGDLQQIEEALFRLEQLKPVQREKLDSNISDPVLLSRAAVLVCLIEAFPKLQTVQDVQIEAEKYDAADRLISLAITMRSDDTREEALSYLVEPRKIKVEPSPGILIPPTELITVNAATVMKIITDLTKGQIIETSNFSVIRRRNGEVSLSPFILTSL